MNFLSVKIGKNCLIGRNVVLGEGNRETLGELVIEDNVIIHSNSVLYYGSSIGNNTVIRPGAVIREHNRIGTNVTVGGLACLGPDNIIGDYTSIKEECFLECVTTGRYVFIAPGVKFLDDSFPVEPDSTSWKGASIGDDTVIGGGSVIGPWINIGSNVLIGMGSVVTKSVPDGEVWFGNPAKFYCKTDTLSYRNSSLGKYVPGNRKRYCT